MRRLVLPFVLVLAAGAWWWLSSRAPTPVPPPPAATPAPTSSGRLTVVPREDPPAEPTAPATSKAAASRSSTPVAPAVPVTEAAPVTGTLHVTSDVPEASVFIDRKFIGTAPVTATDITPGPHRLNVSVAGYDAVTQDIDVTPGARDIAIAFKEVRLAASIQVTHKHGMGSCAGTLRASPQGVTYDTANKGDAFTVTMADIQSFEMDYLGKNLKLKVRGGKTYNFTDPEGNADRLFVFHREVEKVRIRK